MPDSTRFDPRQFLKRLFARETPEIYPAAPAENDPRLLPLLRPARALGPDSRLGEALEILRMSPYRVLPVVQNPDAELASELLGIITEGSIAAALLAADGSERIRLHQAPALYLMEPAPETLTIGHRASEALERLEALRIDALPVTDYQNRLLGMISRADLVESMVRPFRPPLIGGMATPIGVYLTTGGVTGGVSRMALVLTGFLMSLAYLAVSFFHFPIQDMARLLPLPWRTTTDLIVRAVLQTVLVIGLIRFSPMAGYHAAEHQVVHAVERGEPLLPGVVRRMPRVHPRCGTNLATGAALFILPGIALEPLLGEFSFVLSGLIAFAYWRPAGSWVQQHLTTRPASEAEIQSGIDAANEVLARYSASPFQPIPAYIRLWNMGFIPICTGFLLGYGLIALISWVFPALAGPLRPALQNLI